MVVDVDMRAAEMIGFASKVVTPDGVLIWHLMVDGRVAAPEDVAALIGILAIDEAHQLFPPTFFPHRPPVIMLFLGGALRHNDGRVVPPWALRELDQVSSVLLSQHSEFVGNILKTLKGEPAAGFGPVPPGFIYSDDENVARITFDVPRIPVDTTTFPGIRDGKSWYGLIEADYKRNRYMARLSATELGQRAADIMANLSGLNDDAPERPYWFAQFTEVVTEATIRYGSDMTRFNETIQSAEWPTGARPSAVHLPELATTQPLGDPFLVKYGKAQFLEPMLKEGRVRISPASFYAEPSLNAAIRDDELEITLFVGPMGHTGFGSIPGRMAAAAPPSLRRHVRKRIDTNYYVYCTSNTLLPRLMVDFGADSCIVIRVPEEFNKRLSQALRQCLPGWRMVNGLVEYYDPLHVNDLQVDVLTWKNFRYAYQREVRSAWLPPEPVTQLKPLDIILGPLEDICELVKPSK
jgi:hypothetical protein